MAELFVLSIVLISAALIVWRFQQRADHEDTTSKPKSFNAVGIRIPTRACSAVRGYQGKRFLGKEAPKLPVMGCSMAPCQCRYQHFADRRAEDRRVQYGVTNRFTHEAGRERRRVDRRQAIA